MTYVHENHIIWLKGDCFYRMNLTLNKQLNQSLSTVINGGTTALL